MSNSPDGYEDELCRDGRCTCAQGVPSTPNMFGTGDLVAHKVIVGRDTIGYVVLAKRPAPRTEHGWTYETVSVAFPELEHAQNALEWWKKTTPVADPVEYVIGEIVPV